VNAFTIGILFIAVYFALSHIVENRKVHRKDFLFFDEEANPWNGFTWFREGVVMAVATVLLVVGIFLCVSCLFNDVNNDLFHK
jgi:hypothetical protein